MGDAGRDRCMRTKVVSLKQLELKGEAPTQNDWELFVTDEQNNQMYSYGGVRPYDKLYKPTADFHRLNLETMSWTNLSVRFAFVMMTVVFDIFSLPALIEVASAISTVEGKRHMFLFGGCDEDGNPSGGLIAVDLNSFAWFNIEIPRHIPVPRLSATMVAVENRLFIFGGRTKYEDNSPFLSTFSVACYNAEDGWSWQCVDQQYPPIFRILDTVSRQP
ncbi:hypothetical protein R3P38DRAFT_2655342 [Favolaschia claudopus]|uniref:Uncharacterized protein n=1 Tax=Favolaschia claudopus TaxID=2862362 RepID=A0AAV9ZYI2_9AGAR